MPEGLNAVTVMTVHKAKGLEFPVTIVPFHQWRPRPGNDPIPLPDGGGGVMLTRMSKDLGLPYQQCRARELLEQLRLLYVAWTRAAEELHLLLPAGADGQGSSLPILKVVDTLLAATGCPPGADVWTSGARTPPKAAAASPDTLPTPSPEVQAVDHPPGDPLLRWLPRLKVYRNFSLAPEGRMGEAERGTLFHACLERLAGSMTPDAASLSDSDDDLIVRAAVHEALDTFPPLDGAREVHAEELRDAAEWLLTDPRLRHWLAMGRAEAPVLDADGNVHRVDLMIKDNHGPVVLDYKTGRPDPEAHAAQLRRYMRLVTEVHGAPCRGFVVYLDERRIEEIMETTV